MRTQNHYGKRQNAKRTYYINFMKENKKGKNIT